MGVYSSTLQHQRGTLSYITFLYVTVFRYKVTQRTHKCPGKMEADLKYQKEIKIKGTALEIVTCHIEDCYVDNFNGIFVSCSSVKDFYKYPKQTSKTLLRLKYPFWPSILPVDQTYLLKALLNKVSLYGKYQKEVWLIIVSKLKKCR